MSVPQKHSDNPDKRLEMAPDLPMSVFTSTEPWHAERIRALALYCSDGRWGRAFDEFCYSCLQIPRYDRWAVPGGPAWLTEREASGGFAKTAGQQLDFLVKIHELERIVLITHHGCAVYTNGLQEAADACLPAQIEDLKSAARTLRQRHADIGVEGYLAMRSGQSLSFHQLPV